MGDFNYKDYKIEDLCRQFGIPINGRMIRCVLPEHKDEKASMVVNDHSAHCFTCKKTVDVLGFVSCVKSLGDPEDKAVRRDAISFLQGGTYGTVAMPPPQPKAEKERKPPHLYKGAIHEIDYFQKEGDKWITLKPQKVWLYRSPKNPEIIIMAVVGFGREEKEDGKGKGKKIMRPFTPVSFNENGDPDGWYACAPNNKWAMQFAGLDPVPVAEVPLYNQHLLKKGSPVLLVEGEKCAEKAQEWFDKNHDTAGTKRKPVALAMHSSFRDGLHDLAGHPVVIWHDHDEAGRKASAQWVGVLRDLDGTKIYIIPPRQEWRKGYDVADWLEDNPQGDLRSHIINERRLLDFDANKIKVVRPETEEEVSHETGDNKYRVLGYTASKVYVFSNEFAIVVDFSSTASQIAQSWAKICSDIMYWQGQGLMDTKGKVEQTEMANAIMAKATKAGIYNPNRVRRKGVFYDRGKIVANTGEMLYVDGVAMSLHNQQGLDYVYERCENPGVVKPKLRDMTNHEAAKMLAMIDRIKFGTRGQSRLFLGFLVQCIVAGALRWRTHCWLSAERGSGKTWILENIVRRILGRFSSFLGGTRTTEAGLRRSLRGDAFGCIFDEAEVANKNDISAKEAILHLLRSATDSSEDGKVTVQGTTGGEGSVSYLVRSPFLMSSIGVSIVDDADVSRFFFLELRRNRMNEKEFRQYRDDAYDFFDADFPARFFLRCIRRAGDIRESVETFSTAITSMGIAAKRGGDTYGTLMACSWVFVFGRKPTEEEAKKAISNLKIAEEIEISDKNEADDVFEIIMAHEFFRNNKPPFQMLTVGQVIYAKGDTEKDAKNALWHKYGIKVTSQGYIRIFGDSSAIASKIFSNTKYAVSWFGVLSQHSMVVAKGTAKKPQRMPGSLGGRMTRKFLDIAMRQENEGG